MASWIISAVSRTVAPVTDRWARWWAERSRSWWSIIRLVPLAGGRAAVAAVLLNLTIGVLPLGFVVGTSVAIEHVHAIGRPLGSSAWGGVSLALGLAVAALLLQSALSPCRLFRPPSRS